jgi:hypothetical protein
MPRAKAPARKKIAYPDVRFNLCDSNRAKLLKLLGIKRSPLDNVNKILRLYFTRKDLAKGVTPKKLHAEIAPLWPLAQNLAERFNSLSQHSIDFLVSQGLPPEQVQAMKNLSEIANLLKAASLVIGKEAVPRTNWVLETAVTELFFEFHHLKSPHASCDWKEFVSEALAAAKISHPDPITHPDRLTNMLPKSIAFSLRVARP